MKEREYDVVNSPKHYKLRGLDVEYLFRLGKKDDECQDAKKAMKYLEWLVKEL